MTALYLMPLTHLPLTTVGLFVGLKEKHNVVLLIGQVRQRESALAKLLGVACAALQGFDRLDLECVFSAVLPWLHGGLYASVVVS